MSVRSPLRWIAWFVLGLVGLAPWAAVGQSPTPLQAEARVLPVTPALGRLALTTGEIAGQERRLGRRYLLTGGAMAVGATGFFVFSVLTGPVYPCSNARGVSFGECYGTFFTRGESWLLLGAIGAGCAVVAIIGGLVALAGWRHIVEARRLRAIPRVSASFDLDRRGSVALRLTW